MAVPKTAALPLGDAPTARFLHANARVRNAAGRAPPNVWVAGPRPRKGRAKPVKPPPCLPRTQGVSTALETPGGRGYNPATSAAPGPRRALSEYSAAW